MHLGEVATEHPEPVVEVGAEVLDQPRVLGHRLVVPTLREARSNAMSVVGVVMSTRLAMACSIRLPSCSKAALSSGSPGTNAIT